MTTLKFTREHSTDHKKGKEYSVLLGRELLRRGRIQRSANSDLAEEVRGMMIYSATKDNSKGEKKEYIIKESSNYFTRRKFPNFLHINTTSHEYSILDIPKHPNIIKYKGISEDHKYFMMEKCMSYYDSEHYIKPYDGVKLCEIFQGQPTYLKKFAYEAIQGLAHLYQNNRYHNDFKRGNIMLGEDGAIRVMDFGFTTEKTPSQNERNAGWGSEQLNDVQLARNNTGPDLENPRHHLRKFITEALKTPSLPEEEKQCLETILSKIDWIKNPHDLITLSNDRDVWGEMPSNEDVLKIMHPLTNKGNQSTTPGTEVPTRQHKFSFTCGLWDALKSSRRKNGSNHI